MGADVGGLEEGECGGSSKKLDFNQGCNIYSKFCFISSHDYLISLSRFILKNIHMKNFEHRKFILNCDRKLLQHDTHVTAKLRLLIIRKPKFR